MTGLLFTQGTKQEQVSESPEKCISGLAERAVNLLAAHGNSAFSFEAIRNKGCCYELLGLLNGFLILNI